MWWNHRIPMEMMDAVHEVTLLGALVDIKWLCWMSTPQSFVVVMGFDVCCCEEQQCWDSDVIWLYTDMSFLGRWDWCYGACHLVAGHFEFRRLLLRTLQRFVFSIIFVNEIQSLGMLHTTTTITTTTTLIELDYYDRDSRVAITDLTTDIAGKISDVRNPPHWRTMRHFSFNDVCLLASFHMLCFWHFKQFYN